MRLAGSETDDLNMLDLGAALLDPPNMIWVLEDFHLSLGLPPNSLSLSLSLSLFLSACACVSLSISSDRHWYLTTFPCHNVDISIYSLGVQTPEEWLQKFIQNHAKQSQDQDDQQVKPISSETLKAFGMSRSPNSASDNKPGQSPIPRPCPDLHIHTRCLKYTEYLFRCW